MKNAFALTMKSVNEMQMKTRKTWAFNPASKAFKTAKDYNRHTSKKLVERAARMGLY